ARFRSWTAPWGVPFRRRRPGAAGRWRSSHRTLASFLCGRCSWPVSLGRSGTAPDLLPALLGGRDRSRGELLVAKRLGHLAPRLALLLASLDVLRGDLLLGTRRRESPKRKFIRTPAIRNARDREDPPGS